MATTFKQDQSFLDAVISGTLLEDTIHWIAENLGAEDVFPAAELEEWAKGAYDNPDELFDHVSLATWALDNGYVLSE